METLEQEKKHWADELIRAKQENALNEPPVSLKSYLAFVEDLKTLLRRSESNPDLRCRIVQRVVESVRVEPDSFEIRYHVGESQIVEQKENGGSALSATAPSFSATNGSCNLTNGGGGGS